MIKIILAVYVLSLSLTVNASLPRQKPSIESILAGSTDAKFEQLKKLGPEIYSDLKKIAFSEDRALGIRWQAFMAMARLGEKDSLPEVNQALKSKDWFLRHAALKVIPLFDERRAYDVSVVSLNDPALVVRTQAVDTLAKIKNPECTSKLWQQLYTKENYHRNQSLWIRRHIVEALSEFSPRGTEDKFVRVLDDADSTLFPSAIAGLERITGQKLGDANMPAIYKRYLWKKWYEVKKKKLNG